jgi:transcriptional regulator with XRE-family HTH domain
MLSPLMRIAKTARSLRQRAKLTQRQLAAQVGCSQSYLAQVETARRPLSARIAEQLEKRFEKPPGELRSAAFYRGRPPLSPCSKQVLRCLRQARGENPQHETYDPFRPPRFPRLDRAYRLRNPLYRIYLSQGAMAAEDVLDLEDMRPKSERFWRQFNSIRFDSGNEKYLNVKVALLGVQLTGVALNQLGGCRLRAVDGKRGREAGHKPHPAYLISWKDAAVAWYPQRAVRTPRGYRWPDNLLVIARGGRKLTAVVEVNGAKYHNDPAAELRRQQQLGVPVLALDATEIHRAEIVAEILDWAHALLDQPGSEPRACRRESSTD